MAQDVRAASIRQDDSTATSTKFTNGSRAAARWEGCDSKVVFESKKEFKRHQEKNHSPYTPSRCQFPGCSSKVAYTTAAIYRNHLKLYGLKDGREKDKYMP